jgi:CheY-like chemotaxis protein
MQRVTGGSGNLFVRLLSARVFGVSVGEGGTGIFSLFNAGVRRILAPFPGFHVMPTPHILCVSSDPVLLATRKMVLEKAGFTVTTASSDRVVADVCRKSRFDLVLIGYKLQNQEKLRIAETVRSVCGPIPVVEIYVAQPVIEDATHLLALFQPEELIAAIGNLVGRRKRPRSENASS